MKSKSLTALENNMKTEAITALKNDTNTNTLLDVSVNQTKPPIKPKPTISKFILNRIRSADFKTTPVNYSNPSTLARVAGDNDERTTQSMFIESSSDTTDFTNLKNEGRNTVIIAEIEEIDGKKKVDKGKNGVEPHAIDSERKSEDINNDGKNDCFPKIELSEHAYGNVTDMNTCAAVRRCDEHHAYGNVTDMHTCTVHRCDDHHAYGNVTDMDTCAVHRCDERPYANVDFSLDDDNVYENLEPGCEFANQCSSSKRVSQDPSNKLPVPPPRRTKSFEEKAAKAKEKKKNVTKPKTSSPKLPEKKQNKVRHSDSLPCDKQMSTAKQQNQMGRSESLKCDNQMLQIKVTQKKLKQVENLHTLPTDTQMLENNHNCVVDPERPYSNIRPTPVRRQKKVDKYGKDISSPESARSSNRTSSNSPVARRKEKIVSVKKKKSKTISESFKRQRAISANSALDAELSTPLENSKPPLKPKPPKRKNKKGRSKTINPVVPAELLGKHIESESSPTLIAPPRKSRSKSEERTSTEKFNVPSSPEIRVQQDASTTLENLTSKNEINGKSDSSKRTIKQHSQGSLPKPRRPAPPPPSKSKSCDASSLAKDKSYSLVANTTYAVVDKNRKGTQKSKKSEEAATDSRQPSTPHMVLSDMHTFSFPSGVIDSSKMTARTSVEIQDSSAGSEVTESKNLEVLENSTVEQLKSPLSRDNSGSSGRGSLLSNENRNSADGQRNSGLSDDYVLPDIKPLDTNVDEKIYVNQMAASSPDVNRKPKHVSPVLGTRSVPMTDDKPDTLTGDQLDAEQQDGYEDMSKLNIYSVPRACSHTPNEDGKCGCADFTESSGDEDEEGGSLSGEESEGYRNYEPISELTSSGKQMPREDVEMTPEHKRKVLLVANEIRDSERVFVDVLKLLNEDFRSAIEHASFNTSRPVIDEKILDQILGQLPQLQMFNETLLEDLDKRIEEWDENPKLADIFLKKGPYLKLYTSYFRDFERLGTIFDEACNKYSYFGQVVRDFEASPRCMHLAVKHYMLKPIQRIPQYKLLLTDYLKKLNPASNDFADTEAALKIVSEVANHANETMRQGDNFEKLLQIQHSLMGNHEIVKPGRIYKKEGILQKLSRKVMQPRRFYLMSDCLLYTTPYPSGQFKLNNELSLAGMKVSRPVQEDFQNEFSIISVQRSFTLSASTPELRDEWIEALMTAITDYAQKKSSFNLMGPNAVMTENNLMSLGRKAPVWIPDGRVTMCMICTCEFTITWRRHHCRACGKVVCGNCSDNKLPLSYLSSKVARCCDECYSVLQKECPDEEDKEDEVINKTIKKKKHVPKKKNLKANRKMSRPSALKEVAANECNITMSGYLFQKGAKKQWKKYWYVIKDKVLYTYKASEDVAALESMPLLGYDIQVIKEYYEGVEPGLVLQLFHQGRQIRMFKTESKVATEKWRDAMHSATSL
ncbi:uncharacterized protein [Antedon mediterranea]